MKAQARADFHYDVCIDGEVSYLFRDIIPKDFYWFALCENDFPELSNTVQILLIIAMLLDGDESILGSIPKSHIGPMAWWISKEILPDKVMKLEDWFELSFHLCKQRFDHTMDWFENQPVPKLLLMARTTTKFAEKQNREMKKASRKR